MRRMSVLLVGLILLIGAASCGNTSTSAPATASPSDARAKACQALVSIETSLAKLSNVGENTTVGDVKTIQQQIAEKLSTVSSLVARIPGASGDTVDSLATANNQLGTTLEGMSDTATLGESAPKLQEFKSKVTQAQSAQAKLTSALKCTPAP